MRFTPRTGQAWGASGGVLAAGREFAEASLTGARPDLGDTVDLVFTPVVRLSVPMPTGQKGNMP